MQWVRSKRMFGTSAAIFSLLLVVTGLAKLRRPEETSKALSAFGLPTHRLVGWALGLMEVAIGLLALVSSIFLGIQSALYLGFVVWVIAALRLDVPLASCGCLGRADTPPYWGHLALDIVAVFVSLGAVIAYSPVIVSVSLASLAQVVVVGAGVFLSWVVVDHGARLAGAIKE